MKTVRFMQRFVVMAVVMIAALALPGHADAKWSKACAKFSYDGVTVKVIDRHKDIGKPFDTYGYTEFQNRTDKEVTVKWKSYGVLKKGGKLVCTEEDEFGLYPNELRKEVYSYTASRYQPKDFECYVIAIEVTPGLPAEKVAENMGAVYDKVIKDYENGDMTQKDYANAIKFCKYFYYNKFQPLAEIAMAIKRGEREAEEGLWDQWMNIRRDGEKFAQLSDIVEEAYKKDLLDYENSKVWEDFYGDMLQWARSHPDLYDDEFWKEFNN